MVNKSDVFIYGLLDPRQERLGELRYVGQSSRGSGRPTRLHTAKCGSWQKHLHDLGFCEDVWVIEEWDGSDDVKQWLDDTETFYIAYFRMIGADLTNMTDGGDGVRRGYKHTVEAKARMSAGKRGKPHGPMPEKQKQKISQTLTGRAALGRPRVPNKTCACLFCGVDFEVLNSSPRAKRGGCCSRKCAAQLKRKKANSEQDL